MADFQDTISSSKAALQQAKDSVLPDIAGIKQGIAEGTATSDAVFGGDPKEIVEDHGKVRVHRDGSISIVKFDGSILSNVNPDRLEDILAYENAQQQDFESGASDNPVIGLVNKGIGVVGSLVSGGLGLAADATGGTSSQSLDEEIDKYKGKLGGGDTVDPTGTILNEDTSISEDEKLRYKHIKSKLEGTQDGKGTSKLSNAEKAFQESDKYKLIKSLDDRVAKSKLFFESLDETVSSYQDLAPTAVSDDVATSLAYKRVAQEDGTWEAVKHLVINDWDQLIKQGFESIPYMVAFTIGGPIAQTSILTALSKDKARTTTNDFIEEHGREPNEFERSRIALWATVGTVAEKFGDMAALKALPKSLRFRALDIETGVAEILPASIKSVINRTGFIGRAAGGLAGEGLSGAITAASEQIATEGEITDPDQIAFDAVAEALGTPGGVGGLVAGKIGIGTAKGIGKAILNPSEKSTETSTTEPETLTPETEAPEEVDTSTIEPEEFNTQVETINKTIDEATSLAESVNALRTLEKRALLPAQKEKIPELWEKISKKADEIQKNKAKEDEGAGSLKPYTEASLEELKEIRGNLELSEADAKYLDNLIETKQLEIELKAIDSAPIDTAQVHEEIVQGTDEKWTGFDTYVKQIAEITKTVTDQALRIQKIKAVESKMRVHAENMQKKVAAINKALQLPEPKEGFVNVYVGTKKFPGNKNNREMVYTAKTVTREEFEEGRDPNTGDSRKYIVAIDKDTSANLIESIRAEADYAVKMLEVAEEYKTTSFGQTSAQTDVENQKIRDQIEEAQNNPPSNIATAPEVTSEDIESIGTPVPAPKQGESDQLELDLGDSKQPPKESKEEKPSTTKETKEESVEEESPATEPQTPAQQILNDPDSPDPILNSTEWRKREVTVEGGRKVNAGEQWDEMQRIHTEVSDVIRCMRGA